MNRKDFITTTGKCFCTLLATSSVAWLGSCAVSKSTVYTAAVQGTKVVVPESLFAETKMQVVKVPGWQYNLLVVKEADQTFKALLMRCTHRGYPLTPGKNGIHCNQHGSQFDLEGTVVKGPASDPLKAFPVQQKNNELLIG